MASTEDTMYKKRVRTTGMFGQLYETKLVGLALFKLLHDERFEYFYLASNLDEIGCFDDLCFKAKIKGVDRPFLVFIQAKHKDDDNAYVDFDEVKHFHDSYSRVVQKFYLGAQDKKNKDKIFIGNFDDYECVFILYTNGKYKNDSGIEYESAYAGVLNDLISTGRKGTKLHCTDEIVENLTEAVLKVEIEGLAEHFTKFLSASQSMQMMLDDDVKRYHVVLALYVVNVSEIYSDEKKPDFKWRNMTFREDFFTSNDKNIMVLKKAMFRKILQNQAIMKNKKPLKDPKLEEQLQTFLENPCLETLKLLIGTNIVYKNDKLEFASQRSESEKQALKEIKLSQDIIEEAEAIVARDILLSSELKELKVPVTFGNTDLMISEKRITHLAKSIVDLCKKFKLVNGLKIVTLDESVDSGILNINGGLGGTVGNLLIYEESTKLLRFVGDSSSLQNNARLLFEKLQSDLADFLEYRFYVKPMLPLPVLSFNSDSGIAKEISNKLVIYAGQSDQKTLEIQLKRQIEEFQNAKYPNTQAQAESLFQNYHSNIQTWSLLKAKGPYLTKDSTIYQEAINNIFFEPQISSLRNTFHMTKMKHIEYSTESLKTLQQLSTQNDEDKELELAEIAVIVTDVAILTAIKVIQYLKHNGVSSYSILDLECLLNLPTEDFCALKLELKKTEKVHLIMCHNLKSEMIWYEKYLKEIAQVVEGKRKIVITNNIYVDLVQNVFLISDKENAKTEIFDSIIYENHNLLDLSRESQEDVMKNINIVFQGQDISLDSILDETSMPFIEGVILNKIIFNETIEIGKWHSDENYEEIRDFYQDRTVEHIGCYPISGCISISRIVCAADDTQENFINKFVANKHWLQLKESICSVADSDFGVNENSSDMYFNFYIRLYPDIYAYPQDTLNFILDLREKNSNSYNKVKITNTKNKIWKAKITLFDDSMQLRNWMKNDNALEDTLEVLRNLCQDVVLHNIILNEDIEIRPVSGPVTGKRKKFYVNEENVKGFWDDAVLSLAGNRVYRDNVLENINKDFIEKLRIYFRRGVFLHVPDISFVVNNLKDETLENDITTSTQTEQNIDKNDNASASNACLGEPLPEWEENAHNFEITFYPQYQIKLKTFDDVKDDVVLLTAKAGLGKSIILTHLSRKTNKLEKHVWVVRMNLLNYSGEFRKWQDSENIKIDTLTILHFIVRAVFKNITIDLKNDSGKIIFENCSGDVWDRFYLKMFLNYYNKGKLLFIFDGFDEICPDYKNEVLLFLNVVKNFPRKNKMWITSRPFYKILPELEQNFGKSYKLEYLNKNEQSEYLRRWWNQTTNIKFNQVKESNVETLLTMLSTIMDDVDIKLQIICYDYYKYMTGLLAEYNFTNENIKLLTKEIEEVYETACNEMTSEDKNFLGTPLFLEAMAEFFIDVLLEDDDEPERTSIVTLHDSIINTILVKVHLVDKHAIDVSIPFVRDSYIPDLRQTLTLLKKLGAHAIFGSPLFVKQGLNLEDFNDFEPLSLGTDRGLKEFLDTPERIYNVIDKSGLVSYVADGGSPVFITKTFAEYFAVKYIRDILKNEDVSLETKRLLMSVLFSIMMSESELDDRGELVSVGSLTNWIGELCIVDKDFTHIFEDILMNDTTYRSEKYKIDKEMLIQIYFTLFSKFNRVNN